MTYRRLELVASVVAIVLVPACFAWRAGGFDDTAGGGAVVARVANPLAGTGSMTFMPAARSSGPTPELAVPDRAEVVGAPRVADAAHQASSVRLNMAAARQTVTLQLGQQLVVTVGPGLSLPRAHTPPSDAGSAVQPLRTDSAPSPPTSPAAATVFTAVRVGQAVVVAHDSAGSPYVVTVVVQPAPGQRAGPQPKNPTP